MATNSIWLQPGLNQNQFIALTNLLSLRNNGQVEPTSLYKEPDSDERAHDGDDVESLDTTVGQQLSSSGNDTLKMQFLDDIAEFAAKEHGARFVACTAMREREEDVTILIARNTPFEPSDYQFFNNFSGLVSSWSLQQHTPPAIETGSWIVEWTKYFWDIFSVKKASQPLTIENVVWYEMLKYYATRIKNTYIPKLKRDFRKCPVIAVSSEDIHMGSSLTKIEGLRRLVFSIGDFDNLKVDHLSQVVLEANQVRTSKFAKAILVESRLVTSGTRKLWESIYFLGRLRSAFERLTRALSTFPSFEKVRFVPLPKANFTAQSINNPLGLEKTLRLLGLNMTLETVKTLLGPSWTIKGARKKFAEIQGQKLHVHAEVQMLLHLCTTSGWHASNYKYIGCSKRSCFMCWNLLRTHGRYSTRGCHGRLYSRWTVPEVTDLKTDQVEVLGRTLVQVQDSLLKKLGTDFQHVERLQKTSVVGGSSMIGDSSAVEDSRRPELVSHRENILTQQRIAFSFERRERERAESTSLNPVLREYSRSWRGSGSHLSTLSRARTPADYLYQDCLDDRMPDDPEVLENFGFQNLPSFNDRTKLLGLYQGLLKYLNVTPEELNLWQQKKSLVANIIRVYNESSSFGGGAYFPWFLQNTHILEDQRDPKDMKTYERFIEEAQTYLDPDDQKKDWRELQPTAKQEAFEILWMALMGARPNPVQETWLKFGFCACSNEREENKLGAIYTSLLTDQKKGCLVPQHLRSKPCAFAEFWQAYESGRLVRLMEDKIKNRFADIGELPLVREYLSHPPSNGNLSVWDLKRFLEINDYTNHPPIEPVKVDYGFLNCQGFEEICTLAEIYKRLLRAVSPLELHEACIKNGLFELAQNYHSMDEDHRRLMNTSYSMEVIQESLAQKKFFVEDGGDRCEVSFAEFRELLGLGSLLRSELPDQPH